MAVNTPPKRNALRDYFAEQGVIHMVNRVITQAKAADPKQRHLPGLESMPLLITSEGAATRTGCEHDALRGARSVEG
jgi:hypothetical protein